jgi:hypothetical protein
MDTIINQFFLKIPMAMKSFVTVFLYLFFAAGLLAQDVPKQDMIDGPQMHFEMSEYDFGEIEEGPKAKVSFKFTNTGKKPLILENVKASCGCTTPYWPKEPIMPGKSEMITAEYNTQGRPGPFTKSITITANTEPPTKMIHIKGTVKKAPENDGVPIKEKSILMEKE